MVNEAREFSGGALEVGGAIAEHDDCCVCIDSSCIYDGCDQKPEFLKVTFSGISDCGTSESGCAPIPLNCCEENLGSFVMKAQPGFFSSNHCQWNHSIGTWSRLHATSCSGAESRWRIHRNLTGGLCFEADEICTDFENCDPYDRLPINLSNSASCGGSDRCCAGSGGTATLEKV